MMSVTPREPTPLYIQTLRQYDDDESDNHRNHPSTNSHSCCYVDGGYYQTIQTLISRSPSENGGEIETSLQQFVQHDGSVLWRRVLVQSGPSTATPIIHASFRLPDECYPHCNNNHVAHTTSSNNNLLCWASFSEQQQQQPKTTNDYSSQSPPLLLCVLAHPTLLCIWDVYPSTGSNGSSEGNYVPLPFEATGIFALQSTKKNGGLLIQRSETVEDLYVFEMSQHQHQKDDEDDDDHEQEFQLKDPPRPLRVGRESMGGITSLASLNISTTSDALLNNNNNSLVPSLFSLSHPQGDILPVSTNVTEQDPTMMGPFTDVFEKILWVDTMEWVDPQAEWLDRKQHSQPLCVTYHTQLKRHAIWLLDETPPPPAQAPLWQVCSQWRSRNSIWDSHLGVLQQDLEDMELVEKTTVTGGLAASIDGSARNDLRVDALADALGVQQRRITPRNATVGGGTDSAAGTNSRVSRGGHGGTARSNHKATRSNNNNNNNNNHSLISPRTTNLSHNTTQMDLSTSDNRMNESSNMRMGTVGNLFPRVAMTCIYSDATPTVPAEKVFLVSNPSGSAKQSVCLLCPANNVGGESKNPKELRMFSVDLEMEDGNPNHRFVVHMKGTMPCVAAQPIQSSPTPKTYEPHRINLPKSWNGMATDLLLLHKDSATTRGRMSLYRNTRPVVDCFLSTPLDEDESVIEVTELHHAVGNAVDIVYKNSSGESSKCRACVSLLLEGTFLGERLLQAIEAGLDKLGLLDLALKMRADVRRLEFELATSKSAEPCTPERTCIEALTTVILSHFRLGFLFWDVNQGGSNNAATMMDAGHTHWEMMMETNYESILQDCAEFTALCTSRAHGSNLNRCLPFDLLSKLQSLSIQMSRSSATTNAIPAIFDAMHFLYEDMKLYATMKDVGLVLLGSILSLACEMALRNPNVSDEAAAKKFLCHYRRDLPVEKLDRFPCDWVDQDFEMNVAHIKVQLSLFPSPPCFFTWVEESLCYRSGGGALDFGASDVNAACTRMKSLIRIFSLFRSMVAEDVDGPPQQTPYYQIANLLIEEGYSDQSEICDELPVGLSLPLLEALYRCRHEQVDNVANVNPSVWSLIGRNDLYQNLQGSKHKRRPTPPNRNTALLSSDSHTIEDVGGSGGDEDGVDDLEITSSMLFPDDNRIREVCRMLRSSRPIYLKVPRAIEVSDHDYERKKQEKLSLLSRRVLALPVGRGMLTIGNLTPVQAEPLAVPEINLSGRVPPTNASLALDTSEAPADFKVWPEFHNGVAAGLRLPLQSMTSETLSEITRTWIVYNRSSSAQIEPQNNGNTNDANAPSVINHSHGGLLMALGMRGHLNALEMTDVFDYLTHGSITTTVGTLLGMAANMRGTCDIAVSKMLCLHIPSLIPQHFSTIDVASTVQAAAISGTGLLYQGSCHRMMTEFLLNEIGKRPTTDGNVVDRESYTLSCGMALGMVLLCKGGSKADTGAGLADLRIEDRLYRYIVGGLDDAEMRRSRDETDRLSLPNGMSSGSNEKCSCIYEGESINTDITSPGATLALGLMYMQSGNETIASAISLPDTHFLLEYVRPDFLMLRVIARALILWDSVQPTTEWVEKQIPRVVREAYDEMRVLSENSPQSKDGSSSGEMEYDRQAVRLIYTHVVAGACFAIGLRFAGTGNIEAASAIFDRVFELRELRDASNAVSTALRPPTPVLEMCLGCAAVSLSMVLAGTGHLEALRLLKILRWPCVDDQTYGGHQAYATAIGLLFLGGGTCTLGRDPEDIAALVMAFFPRYPSSTSDNQYHLQALRNLYALATKKRELRAIDVDTGENVHVPVEIHFENESAEPLLLSTPCLLLNCDEKPKELRVVSKRYYPLKIAFERGFDEKAFFVKRKSAYLSHGEDPLSQKSILTSLNTYEVTNSLDFISSFTGDSKLMQLATHLCDFRDSLKRSLTIGSWSMPQFCSQALHECLLRDTLEVLPLYIALRNHISNTSCGQWTLSTAAWDHRLVRSYCQHICEKNTFSGNEFLNSELMTNLVQLMEKALFNGSSSSDLQSIYFNLPLGFESAEEKIDSDRMDLS
ncbi:anaphase-promoting complex subunit 1 [Nitzschia inconspicua]|uniref:Anaphase-promoting complex subunit 1 n=1 Tax=Nitzschia inconspicua TaxID=303405 RepID=A0A9K3PZ25_9STRA|nr:anaphase-promoting complex subunit 1 [Nitzschia inconspicua]